MRQLEGVQIILILIDPLGMTNCGESVINFFFFFIG